MNIEPGYEPIAAVLQQALDQAQYGKGKERHANNKPFIEQPMIIIREEVGRGFTLGQIIKKAEEVPNITTEEGQIQELLSIIVYAAGEVICIEKELQDRKLKTAHDLYAGYTPEDLAIKYEVVP